MPWLLHRLSLSLRPSISISIHTSASPPPLPSPLQAQNLLSPLGFHPDLIQKLLSSKSLWKHGAQNLAAVVASLQTLHLSPEAVASLLSRMRCLPTSADVRRQLELLASIGIEPERLGKFVAQVPSILRLSSDALQAQILYLQGVPLDDRTICRIFLRRPAVLRYSLEEKLPPRLEFVRDSLGMNSGHIQKLLAWRPAVISTDLEKLIVNCQLLQELGFIKGSKAFLMAFIYIADRSPVTIRGRVQNMVNCGFTRSEVMKIVLSSPSVLALGDETVREKVGFLVNVMKRPLSEIVLRPSFLGHSLGKKIKPRYEAFSDCQANRQEQRAYSLAYMLDKSDAQFRQVIESITDKKKS